MQKAPPAGGAVSFFFKHLDRVFPVRGTVGATLLDVAHAEKVPLEGACEGSLACSTCHVVCPSEVFNGDAISERENDLLDMAYGLRPTSRLGCQVRVTPEFAEKTFEIPRCTRNLAVDGFVPKPH